MEAAIEAGAMDVEYSDGVAEVITTMEGLEAVRSALEEKGFRIESANLTRIPQNTVALEGKSAQSMLKLMEVLEDHDDVQNVYANFDIPEEIMEQAS